MECDKLKEAMIEVLYGEADASTEAAVRAHQNACSACSEELTALRSLRRDLASWTLPESHKVRRRVTLSPYLAAAAVIVLAVGAAVGFSGSEARYENGAFAFRLGRGSDISVLLAQQEERHRQEIEALRKDIAGARPIVAASDSEALLRDVRRMIEESERRQARHVEVRLTDLREETEAQRRYDLAQVGAGLSYLEGKTGLQAARTTELMGHVFQAAQKR